MPGRGGTRAEPSPPTAADSGRKTLRAEEREKSRTRFIHKLYVPGVHAHPRRDPTGHSYRPAPQLDRHPPWAPEEWRTLDDWLYGVDLFNRFYFWEAHEAWEGLWAAA